MRYGLIYSTALWLLAGAIPAPASSAPRAAATPANCPTSVVFGEPAWRTRTLTFRATIEIACPLGVSFSAALRSSNGCELRSSTGSTLRYELFADETLQAAVVSCERATAALSGVGRRSFVVYGRVDGPAGATGDFRDALTASITP